MALIGISEDIERVVPSPSVIALGFFDGVHLGHRKVLEKCASLARAGGKLARVFTFTSKGVLPKHKSGIIQDEQEKGEIFSQIGIDEIIVPEFSTFCDITAEEFIEKILVKSFGATDLVCGENYRFGKGGRGDTVELKRVFEQYGGTLHIVEDELLDGIRLSSTRIRRALTEGDLVFAERALARPFSIAGVVQHGKKLGREISFPTINIFYPSYRVYIPNGVYLTAVEIDEGKYWGITNVGTRPTVNSDDDVLIECHILDYEGNLYGREARIYFKNLLRSEKKFATIDELKAQISRDEYVARKLLSDMGVYAV